MYIPKTAPGTSIGAVIADPNEMDPDSAMYQDKKFRHRPEISVQQVE